MKINCATRKKSKDFQAAQTSSQKIFSQRLQVLPSHPQPPPFPLRYMFVASLGLASLLDPNYEQARDSHLRPAADILKRKGQAQQHVLKQGIGGCVCVCVLCTLRTAWLKFKLSFKQNMMRSCSCRHFRLDRKSVV